MVVGGDIGHGLDGRHTSVAVLRRLSIGQPQIDASVHLSYHAALINDAHHPSLHKSHTVMLQ